MYVALQTNNVKHYLNNKIENIPRCRSTCIYSKGRTR